MNSESNALSNQDLAQQIQSLLSSSPPFIDDNSIKVLNQLLQPAIINTTTTDCSSLWSCLDSLQPPQTNTTQQAFQLDSFLTNALSSSLQPIPIEIKDMYQQLMIASSNYSSSAVEGGGEELYAFRASSNSSMEILDDGSICLSCSLSPKNLSDVTLTPHSIILSPLKSSSNSSSVMIGGINSHWWDFGWNSHNKESEKIVMIARKVWKPEVDKISIKCSWWGFEIYIPHTIMINLDKKVDPYLEALKTISEVLNFIVDHIPEALSLLPPVALLKTILPIISTIAGFFIWYWKKVERDDTGGAEGLKRGNGVILAATWILPVALVPREWKKDERSSVAQKATTDSDNIRTSDGGITSKDVLLAMNSEPPAVNQDLIKEVEQKDEEDNDVASIAESLANSPLVTSIISPVILLSVSGSESSNLSSETIDNFNLLDKLLITPSNKSSIPQQITSTHFASTSPIYTKDTEGIQAESDEVMGIDLIKRSEKLSGILSFVKRKK